MKEVQTFMDSEEYDDIIRHLLRLAAHQGLNPTNLLPGAISFCQEP